MGSNRRYAAQIDARMDETILERHVMTAGPLQSLTADELQLDIEPVTISPRPAKARAWVRFGPETARVECRVERWTEHACGISFEVKGTVYRCWVWAGAVRPAEPLRGNAETPPSQPKLRGGRFAEGIVTR